MSDFHKGRWMRFKGSKAMVDYINMPADPTDTPENAETERSQRATFVAAVMFKPFRIERNNEHGVSQVMFDSPSWWENAKVGIIYIIFSGRDITGYDALYDERVHFESCEPDLDLVNTLEVERLTAEICTLENVLVDHNKMMWTTSDLIKQKEHELSVLKAKLAVS